MSLKNKYPNVCVNLPKILLPNPNIELTEWSVVACDQFTSQPDYWEEVAATVEGLPSTLNMIFPEVYLGKGDDQSRIEQIHQSMQYYLNEGILIEHDPSLIYVERRTNHGHLRRGLVLTVDLECYDYTPGSQTLIRATEGTVLERIPPRVKIRDGAVLESPHIMLLIDDPECRVIEPLAEQKDKLDQLYNFELMMNGGSVAGYKINQPEILADIYQGLASLADKDNFNRKYGLENREVLLFAVGDGNHSLATAKAVWEKIKKEAANPSEIMDHPARYALVEVVNIHDQGLLFEPIHRVLFNVNEAEVIAAMKRYFESLGSEFNFEISDDADSRIEMFRREKPNSHVIKFYIAEKVGLIVISKPSHNLEVGTLQAFIDAYLKEHTHTEVDYIHGAEVVADLGSHAGNMGFYLPVMSKSALFKTVIVDGVLPRKTFSMGEAEEKRYYLECRKIVV